jgi:hypothetical protein
MAAICKECSKFNNKTQRESSVESRRLYRRKYNEENKEANREYSRSYYVKNKEKELERSKENYSKNIEKYREYNRVFKLNNPDYNSIWSKNKRITCRKFLVKGRIRCLIRASIKNKGYSNNSKTRDILGCDWDFFLNHLCGSFEFNYGIPREYIPWNDVHIDHIIPLARASDEDALIKLNHYKNLQLLFAEDNLLKRDKDDYEI